MERKRYRIANTCYLYRLTEREGVQQQRLEKRKQYQQAIILILLNYRFSEESAFHVLPLEMVHLIIRFVLDDMPAATTLDISI